MGLVSFLRAQWDRTMGVLSMAAGGVAILVGWVGVSGAVYPAEQLPYLISGGLGGLFLLGVGGTLWLSADLRDEWRHLDRLETAVEQRLLVRLESLVAETAPGQTSPGKEKVPAQAARPRP